MDVASLAAHSNHLPPVSDVCFVYPLTQEPRNMNKLMIYGLGIALAAPLSAQNNTLYSPPGLDTKTEGYYYGYYGFRYPNARVQFIDGENRGTTAVIGALHMRLDYRSHTSTTTVGRKWTSVMMSIGEGNIDQFSNTFANNFTTSPTVVFNSAWSLPTFTGTPSTNPAPYGGTNGEYTVPFSSTFVYSGKGDICQDWTFMGGTLDNAVSWASSSSRTYYFDGGASPTSAWTGSPTGYIPSTTLNGSACNDSSMTHTTSAYLIVNAARYPKNYTIENYQDRILFYHYSYYTGFNNPIIHAISLKNDIAGVELGTGCHKLHVAVPMALVPKMTLPVSINSSGYSGYRLQFIPWRDSLAGITISGQGAWLDSVTNQFKLTRAYQATTAPVVLPSVADERLQLYAYNSPTATTAQGFTASYIYNPVFAYTTK